MEELIGTKYRILDELGRGGMAAVYRAEDTILDRKVAVKLLNPQVLQRGGTLLERFRREAKTMASLRHPNIIRIFDFGEHEGKPFIVMPYLSGPSLDKLIAQQGAFEPAQALRIAEEIGAALDYAHQKDVIHRDVKPANVLFDEQNYAILTDFGIVKLVDESTAITQGGTLGTPYYMPPEQWKGEEVDARSDLYALGVVIYQMLTGRLPFEGDTTSVMQGHLKEMPPPPQLMNAALPQSVETVLLKALDKEPEKRYQTASQLVAHLKAALADILKPTVIEKPSRKSGFVWIAAAALVALLICGGSIATISAGMNGGGPVAAWFATETPTVTNTPIPIETPAPTNTPIPTETSLPTNTSSPPTDIPPTVQPPTDTPVPPTHTPTATLTLTPTTSASAAIPPTLSPPPSSTYQLTYTKFDGTFHNIYIADINGQNERLIIARAGSPSFSPDNKLYFFGEQGINTQMDPLDKGRLWCDFPTISGGIVAIDLMSPLSHICDVQDGLWTCFRRGAGDDVCTANNISVYQNLDWKEGSARLVTIARANPLLAYDAIPSNDVFRIYFRNAIDSGGPANTEILGEHPSWSPDGQRLAYRSGRENKFGIWVSNRDDSKYDWVVWNSPSHPALSPSFPTWSPDNQTIAYSGFSDQGKQDIYTRKWDRSNEEQNLTNASSNDILPVYTPDGKYIIFRSDRGGSWGIWRMNSDGTDQVQIIPNANVQNGKWELSKMDVR